MEFIHGFMDPNFSWESADPQACRPLSDGQECQLVSKESAGLCKEFSGGLKKRFFTVAESLEKRGGETAPRLSAVLVGRAFAEQTDIFTDTWALLSAQKTFVNVPSSQHFPVIGMV